MLARMARWCERRPETWAVLTIMLAAVMVVLITADTARWLTFGASLVLVLEIAWAMYVALRRK